MTPAKRPAALAKDSWKGFRDNARMHLRDAENKLALLDDGTNAKGIAADAVLAGIAFGDAITVQRLGQHNVHDHGTLPDLVQRALGKDVVVEQIARLRRIVKEKSRAQYGGSTWTQAEAEEYLKAVRRFSTWAEQLLAERE